MEIVAQTLIENFVSHKKIAIIGLSRKGTGFGVMALKELEQKGYQVSPIHHEVKEINGHATVKSVAELPQDVESLLVCLPPQKTVELLETLPGSRVKNVWIQQGASDEKVLEKIEELGIKAVVNKCILMYAEPVKGLHKFHKVINNFFSKN